MKGKDSNLKNNGKPSERKPLETPNEKKDTLGSYFETVLEGIDREIIFYRRRAGQLYFFLFLVEGIFLVGDRKLIFPEDWESVSVFVNAFLYFAIAFTGVYLGQEYRNRIHKLKYSRIELLEAYGYENAYPTHTKESRSEIKTLYRLLIFLSIAGIIITLLPSFL